MKLLVFNKSRKKRFRTTKRIINALIPSISNRLNIGNLPKRTINQLIMELKKHSGRGTQIEIFIENRDGYHGFEVVIIGKKRTNVDMFLINSVFNI